MSTQADENERIWNFIAFHTPRQEYVQLIVKEKPDLFIKEEIWKRLSAHVLLVDRRLCYTYRVYSRKQVKCTRFWRPLDDGIHHGDGKNGVFQNLQIQSRSKIVVGFKIQSSEFERFSTWTEPNCTKLEWIAASSLLS